MKLYPHQEKALKDTAHNANALYALDMGLGKTYIGSEKMRQIGNRVNLIVCQKSKIDDWKQHIHDNYMLLPNNERWFDGGLFDLTNPNALEMFVSPNVQNADCVSIGIINYELLFRRPELMKLHDFTLMLDESSLIQNESTKRARFILKMDYANVILLSGTVVNGNYEKLWSQCHLLGWPIPKDLFYRHYMEFETVEVDGFKRKIITGYKNIDRLKRKLRDYGGVFVKTNEVFDLPSQNDVFVWVDCTDEYMRFCKHPIITIGEKELVGDYQLTERMYKKMLCSQYSEPKLKAFRDIVDSTDDRLIVFYTYTGELEAMVNEVALTGHPLSLVNGNTKDLASYEKYDNSITFVQYQAGAMGLNLQKANKIVYFSLPDGWSEGFEQSRKRIHRIGQERPCFYYILLTKDSIEGEIWEALGQKKDRTNALFEEGN